MTKHGLTSTLREVPVEEAIGMVLAHDLTQIIPGQFKGRLFRKGHRITHEDIPKLLDIGKAHIYAIELAEDEIHEDDAALRMARALQGDNTALTDPYEGKVSIKSQIHGLAQIHKPTVDAINGLGDIALATIKTNTVVQPGQSLAATRVIPLITKQSKMEEVERLSAALRNPKSQADQAVIQVRPFIKHRVGLITTGSEVFHGRIQDKFGPVVRAKVEAFGSEIVEQRFVTDDLVKIVTEISYLRQQMCDMILLTGGMSVDPDDRTPGAIRQAGAEIVRYGTPMLPGSMLLMGYLEGIPILGLPGCVMHDPFTSFDALLPRILAGDRIEEQDIIDMGYGGLIGC
jgi:molybdenum cofactor synthesis domain-containing protein